MPQTLYSDSSQFSTSILKKVDTDSLLFWACSWMPLLTLGVTQNPINSEFLPDIVIKVVRKKEFYESL